MFLRFELCENDSHTDEVWKDWGEHDSPPKSVNYSFFIFAFKVIPEAKELVTST